MKWTIFLIEDKPILHEGNIREKEGVFYCYDNYDNILYMIPVRKVSYIRKDT